MDFSPIAAVLAGFIATIALSLTVEVASWNGITRMPSFPMLVGSFLTADRDLAIYAGSLLHYLLIGPIGFGVSYAASLVGIGAAHPLWFGTGIGLVHGALVGVALGAAGKRHPRVEAGPARAIASPWGLVIPEPGVLGVGWGDLTPVVFVTAHVVYGFSFAFLYLLLS